MFPSAPLTQDRTDFQARLPGQLMSVIAELTDVIEEENAVMAEGMPAAVINTVDRKQALSDAYEELLAELVETRSSSLAADPDMARKLMDAVLALREVTQENLVRLEAAMNASKRRVEAVMAAMRSEARIAQPYGAKGDIPLGARLAAFGKDFHA
jgi:FlgN protein.